MLAYFLSVIYSWTRSVKSTFWWSLDTFVMDPNWKHKWKLKKNHLGSIDHDRKEIRCDWDRYRAYLMIKIKGSVHGWAWRTSNIFWPGKVISYYHRRTPTMVPSVAVGFPYAHSLNTRNFKSMMGFRMFIEKNILTHGFLRKPWFHNDSRYKNYANLLFLRSSYYVKLVGTYKEATCSKVTHTVARYSDLSLRMQHALRPFKNMTTDYDKCSAWVEDAIYYDEGTGMQEFYTQYLYVDGMEYSWDKALRGRTDPLPGIDKWAINTRFANVESYPLSLNSQNVYGNYSSGLHAPESLVPSLIRDHVYQDYFYLVKVQDHSILLEAYSSIDFVLAHTTLII